MNIQDDHGVASQILTDSDSSTDNDDDDNRHRNQSLPAKKEPATTQSQRKTPTKSCHYVGSKVRKPTPQK